MTRQGMLTNPHNHALGHWQGSFKVWFIFINFFNFAWKKSTANLPCLVETTLWNTQWLLNPCIEMLLFTEPGFPCIAFSPQSVFCITNISLRRNGLHNPFGAPWSHVPLWRWRQWALFLLEKNCHQVQDVVVSTSS